MSRHIIFAVPLFYYLLFPKYGQQAVRGGLRKSRPPGKFSHANGNSVAIGEALQ